MNIYPFDFRHDYPPERIYYDAKVALADAVEARLGEGMKITPEEAWCINHIKTMLQEWQGVRGE